MKLCFVCNEYPPSLHGGIGTTTQILATELVRRGHQVRVIGVYPENDTQPDFQADNGVQVFRLRVPKGRFGWLIARIHLFRTIAKWVDAGELDLIEVPDYEGYAAGWLPLNIPVITRVVGSGSYNLLEQGKSPIKKYFWIEQASYNRSDFYCAMSAYAARRAESIYGLKENSIQPIYNPVEISMNHNEIPSSTNKVVFTGTLVPRKGIISLIKAWPSVVQEYPTAELHVYGKDGRAPNGTSMMAYLETILPHHIRNSVHFHGHIAQQNLWRELAIARVAVFPSYSETFGNAPVEAMSTGCPTIYTQRSCGPEIIEHEVDGLLVDPDNPNEISASIIRILSEDKLAFRLGNTAQQKVKMKFSVDNIVSQNESFYCYCIEGYRQKQPAGG